MNGMTFRSIIVATTVTAAAGFATCAQAASGDTLAAVQARGELHCTSGDGNHPGFFEIDDKGQWHGIDIDYCKAVTVAIFGTPEKVKLIPISWAQRFPSLQSGDLDLVIKATGWTMGRDTELGVQFSLPYFYGGAQFLVKKELNAESVKDLQGGTICATSGTSTERLLADYIKANNYDIKVVSFEKNIEAANAFFADRCDSIAEYGPVLSARRASAADPDLYQILPDILSMEPQAAAMRHGDDAWVDLVNWVFFVGRIAEENGITSGNIDEQKANPKNPTVAKLLGVTPGIGKRLGLSDDWAYNVIKTVGNAEEIYERNLGEGSPYKLPRGVNAPWQKGGAIVPPTLD